MPMLGQVKDLVTGKFVFPDTPGAITCRGVAPMPAVLLAGSAAAAKLREGPKFRKKSRLRHLED